MNALKRRVKTTAVAVCAMMAATTAAIPSEQRGEQACEH